MSLKLFALVVLAALAFAKAQSPADSVAAAAPPTFEDLVNQQAAKVQYVVQLLVDKSVAPPEQKEAVQLAAAEQVAACVAAAEVNPNLGAFYACTGRVIKQASDALSAASSGASGNGV
uniref:Putative conserved secreted protein n=1 Tax=Culex tarsalis TaxID=7177 RepID=A0A1Q3FL50_CULTA